MKRLIALTAGATVLLGLVAVTDSHAAPSRTTASQTHCRTWVEENVRWPLDPNYRVGAQCTSIAEGKKVRGVMDLTAQVDEHTEWFTTTGTIHYTPWRMPFIGSPDSRIEEGDR